jgi:hypothetical protein
MSGQRVNGRSLPYCRIIFHGKGEINLKEYIDYFLSEGILRPEWYLSSIEIGSEIASGTGKITFKRFVVY